MKPGVTIIIPCRNEHGSIREVVREIDDEMFWSAIPGGIIIVDDNSRPPLTIDDLVSPGLHATPRLYKNLQGPGLAEALKTGIIYAEHDYVIFMSGDGTDNPEYVPLYYKALKKGIACVFGQRKWTRESYGDYPPVKDLLSRLGNRLTSLFFDWRYSDYTDLFKGYRLGVVHTGLSCRSKGFAFPMELCLRAIMSGVPYKVVPVRRRNRIAGTSKFRLCHEVPEYLIALWRCLKLKYNKRGK